MDFLRNFKLVVEFKGSKFHGWQIQSNVPTVQGEFIKVFDILLKGIDYKFYGCSRTDAGVHAINYVASLHLRNNLKFDDVEKFRKAINSLISRDIYVKKIEEVSPGFHARKSAKYKIYKYRVLKGFSPLRRGFVWEIAKDIDFAKLEEAAKLIVGKHDFSYFSLEEGECFIYESFWRKSGDEFHFYIKGNRFLWKMVRGLVGMMIRVATGKMKVGDFLKMLRKEKKENLIIAPPCGLYLLEVGY